MNRPNAPDWAALCLVVFSQDDNLRFLARSTFRQAGVREILSTSVAADAPALMAHEPALVIIDLDVDPAQALAFLDRVRNGPGKNTPAVVLFKIEDRPHLAMAKMLGIEAEQAKPISSADLLNKARLTILCPTRMQAERAAPEKPRLRLGPEAVAAQPKPPPIPAVGEADDQTRVDMVRERLAKLGIQPRPAAAPKVVPRAFDFDSQQARVDAVKAQLADMNARSAAAAQPAKPPAKAKFDPLDGTEKPKPSGKFEDDGPPAAAPKPAAERLEIAPPKPRPKNEKAKAEWQDAVVEAGHESRTGADVAALDVTAIVTAHIEWLKTHGAQGKRAQFEGQDLAGADLSRTVLASAGFKNAELSDATLAESRLDGADLRFATLGATDCSGAIMAVAQLRHADLRLANLEGCNLRGADLSGARLGGARLAGANLDGAILVETDLSDTDLSKVENLRQSQLDKARPDRTTLVPPGLWVRMKDEE